MSAVYDYQEQARRLLESGRQNLLVVAPTGAGKTEVGIMALEQSGKGCYVAPTRSLCYEKHGWLQERFPEVQVVLGNKDYGLGCRLFQGSDFRVITSWKLNQLLTTCPQFGEFSPEVILDEIHRLDPYLEFIVTKLRLRHPQVRVTALSATIHEDDEPKFVEWLGAVAVKGEERPVPLIERLVQFEPDLNDAGDELTVMTVTEYGGGEINRVELGYELQKLEHVWQTWGLIRATDNAPVLVYTPYRMRANLLGDLFADKLAGSERWWSKELQELANELPVTNEATESLKRALPYGVGIHHGGMSQQERELVQNLALAGKLQVIITCLTLAQGINLPARHIIFESVYAHDDDNVRRLLDVSLFRQLEGRAGRPQFDTVGYAWIPVHSEVEKVEVEEVLLKYRASKIVSRVSDEFFLTSQVPSLVFLGWTDAPGLVSFVKQTYWGMALQDTAPLFEQLERIIRYLIDRECIEVWGRRLVLTAKGQKCARLGLHPLELEAIERLIEVQCLDYNQWAAALGRIKADGSDEFEAVLERVVDYGLTVYTLPDSNHRERDLGDYVQRTLDIAESYMALVETPIAFRKEWRESVGKRFMYGNLVLVQTLAPALNRGQIKRLVRNLGQVCQTWNYNLSHADQVALARCLYGHYREFKPGDQVRNLAEILGFNLEYWLAVINVARKGEMPKEAGNE